MITTPGASRTPRRGPYARGFMLLEVLVAIVIFSIGVLGLVGLQASMTKTQTGSKFRADAAFLAQRLIGTMWTDPANLASYSDANCAGYARCSNWAADVAAKLPAAAVSVTAAAGSPDVTITIRWTPPNEEQRRYTTTSSIATN